MEYKRVRVRVEFEECLATPETNKAEPTKVSDGCFEVDFDRTLELDINTNEQAVLAVSYPAIRDALASELSRVSKKKSKKQQV